ncbi:Benzyl alcohol O-benzoyltransferase [Bienertia sinuspersici]
MVDAQGIAHSIMLRPNSHLAQSFSIKLVWSRHLLRARDPPRVTCQHREYEKIVVDIKDDTTIAVDDGMVHKSFCFASPQHIKCSTYEIISACLWRCHTISLRLDPEEIVKMMTIINAQPLYNNPPLPRGYYGNVVTFPVAISTAAKLSRNPISYALELLKNVKAQVTLEYMRSLTDYMVLNDRPIYTMNRRTMFLSDVTRAQAIDFDLGWGQPIYASPLLKALSIIYREVFMFHMTMEKETKGLWFQCACQGNLCKFLLKS